MNSRTKSWVSYITWVPGLIFFLLEKDDKTVRVHAAQSMIFGLGYSIITWLLGWIPFFRGFNNILWIGYVAISIVCILRAYQGDILRIPYIIDYAEKMA